MKEFDFNSAKSIIGITGKRLKKTMPNILASDLNEAAERFRMYSSLSVGPTKTQKLALLRKLSRHIEGLVTALGVQDNQSVQDSIPWLMDPLRWSASGEELKKLKHGYMVFALMDKDHASAEVSKAVDGLVEFRTWIAEATKYVEDNAWHGKKNAQTWLISRGLDDVYLKHSGQRLGYSNSPHATEEPYGPSIRFVQSVLKKMGISKSPVAIAKTISRHKN